MNSINFHSKKLFFNLKKYLINVHFTVGNVVIPVALADRGVVDERRATELNNFPKIN